MYLIDSDHLINYLNGQEKAVQLFRDFPQETLFTSIICVAEVLDWLYFLKDEKKLHQFVDFLQNLQVVDVDMNVAYMFAQTRGNLRREGKLIDNFDLLIAATCLAYDLILVTGNLSHFKRIHNLKIFSN